MVEVIYECCCYLLLLSNNNKWGVGKLHWFRSHIGDHIGNAVSEPQKGQDGVIVTEVKTMLAAIRKLGEMWWNKPETGFVYWCSCLRGSLLEVVRCFFWDLVVQMCKAWIHRARTRRKTRGVASPAHRATDLADSTNMRVNQCQPWFSLSSWYLLICSCLAVLQTVAHRSGWSRCINLWTQNAQQSLQVFSLRWAARHAMYCRRISVR